MKIKVIYKSLNAPITIDDSSWFYREKDSLSVVKEVKDKMENYLRTELIKIPLDKIFKKIK